jgi:hypothetical protein
MLEVYRTTDAWSQVEPERSLEKRMTERVYDELVDHDSAMGTLIAVRFCLTIPSGHRWSDLEGLGRSRHQWLPRLTKTEGGGWERNPVGPVLPSVGLACERSSGGSACVDGNTAFVFR